MKRKRDEAIAVEWDEMRRPTDGRGLYIRAAGLYFMICRCSERQGRVEERCKWEWVPACDGNPSTCGLAWGQARRAGQQTVCALCRSTAVQGTVVNYSLKAIDCPFLFRNKPCFCLVLPRKNKRANSSKRLYSGSTEALSVEYHSSRHAGTY